VTTAEILNQLNIYFYEQVSEYFDSSRQYFWPGWEELKKHVLSDKLSVLDIGCGNGRFGEFMEENGLLKSYHGIDTDGGLLDKGRERYPEWQFTQHDAIADQVESAVQFDLIVSFGVLHHIPSTELRSKFFHQAAKLLAKGGYVCFSTWNFLGIDPESKRVIFDVNSEVDGELISYLEEFKHVKDLVFEVSDLLKEWKSGDYLLSWKRGTEAIRFAHDYTREEVENLAQESGLSIVNTWTADGPGNKGNEYYLMREV
jgi:tRNA (uracil-5-)-methyltransferase TRM9